MLAEIIAYLFIFVFGLIIGSFLNCAIYRMESKKNLKGRSFCPHCKHALSWKDLFPVLSFAFLGGKCRYCKKKISWQYPAVELATGIIFLLVFAANISDFYTIFRVINLAFWFYMASALIFIFIYDLKHFIIPDKVLFPAIATAFAWRVLGILAFAAYSPKGILDCLAAVAVSAGFFLAIFLVSQGRWMGFGDVKLAVLMGLLLGFSGVLAALFLSFFFGAAAALLLIIAGRKKLKSEIPFGPFLVLGTFTSLFWGEKLISWYLNLFQI